MLGRSDDTQKRVGSNGTGVTVIMMVVLVQRDHIRNKSIECIHRDYTPNGIRGLHPKSTSTGLCRIVDTARWWTLHHDRKAGCIIN